MKSYFCSNYTSHITHIQSDLLLLQSCCVFEEETLINAVANVKPLASGNSNARLFLIKLSLLNATLQREKAKLTELNRFSGSRKFLALSMLGDVVTFALAEHAGKCEWTV